MPTILHTEASLGLGGQELRILAETRWLRDHGWGALVAGQPGSGLLAEAQAAGVDAVAVRMRGAADLGALWALRRLMRAHAVSLVHTRSEEHTSELQSRLHLVCRLLLEKKKKKKDSTALIDHTNKH